MKGRAESREEGWRIRKGRGGRERVYTSQYSAVSYSKRNCIVLSQSIIQCTCISSRKKFQNYSEIIKYII